MISKDTSIFVTLGFLFVAAVTCLTPIAELLAITGLFGILATLMFLAFAGITLMFDFGKAARAILVIPYLAAAARVAYFLYSYRLLHIHLS